MSEVPYWCSESLVTGSYVAAACLGAEDPLKGPLDRASRQIRHATDHFIGWVAEVEPLQLDGLDFTQQSAWHGLSGQLVERFRKSHWELIQSDPSYRDALGASMDDFRAATGSRMTQNESLQTRQRRHAQEGHKMAKHATSEGIPVSVAAHAVVPGVVRLRRPTMPRHQQVLASTALVPAAAALSRELARLSERGNNRLLRGLSGATGKIPYASLSFMPNALDIANGTTGKNALRTVGDHREPHDLQEPFRGCPALMYGSITVINKMLAQIIMDNAAYEHAIPQESSEQEMSLTG